MTIENPKGSNTSEIKEINDALINSILTGDINVETTSNEAMISTVQSNNLITALSRFKGKSFEQAFIATAIICQKGGTAKKASGDIYAIVAGVKYTLTEIRTVIKDNHWNFTLRQFARANANQIHATCSRYSVPGDLAKKITRTHENLTQDDTYWLANYQMDNPCCPYELRQLLIQHYESLFPHANKTIKS